MSECREIAERVVRELVESGKCEIAEIAGSLRRGEEYTHDVDIVCADATKSLHTSTVTKLDRNTCKIDVFSAHPKHFGAMLLRYTGPKGSNIGMSTIAKKKDMLLNQYGLFDRVSGELVASETEDDIYRALGKPWKSPELRGR